MKKNRILAAALFLLGSFIVLTPVYILPVCEFYGKPKMACSYTGRAEMFIGALLISVAIAAFASKAPARWLMFVSFFVSISVIAIPEVLGYCHNPQMPCNYGTVPMLRLLGGLSAAASAAGFMISRSPKRDETKNFPV